MRPSVVNATLIVCGLGWVDITRFSVEDVDIGDGYVVDFTCEGCILLLVRANSVLEGT